MLEIHIQQQHDHYVSTITCGVPQGSVCDPLHIQANMLHIKEEVDNTFHKL